MGRARGKLCLQPIKDDRSRRQTFKKRKVGLKKKMHEFSTLCDVQACLLCYGPDGELETWPEEEPLVRSVVERFNAVDPDERIKRQENVYTVMEGKKKKLDEQVKNARRSNWESLYLTCGDELDSFSEEKLRDLVLVLDERLGRIKENIDFNRMRESCMNGKGKENFNQALSLPGQQESWPNNPFLVDPATGTPMMAFWHCGVPYLGPVYNPAGFGFDSKSMRAANDFGFDSKNMVHQPSPLQTMPSMTMQGPSPQQQMAMASTTQSMPMHGFEQPIIPEQLKPMQGLQQSDFMPMHWFHQQQQQQQSLQMYGAQTRAQQSPESQFEEGGSSNYSLDQNNGLP